MNLDSRPISSAGKITGLRHDSPGSAFINFVAVWYHALSERKHLHPH